MNNRGKNHIQVRIVTKNCLKYYFNKLIEMLMLEK